MRRTPTTFPPPATLNSLSLRWTTTVCSSSSSMRQVSAGNSFGWRCCCWVTASAWAVGRGWWSLQDTNPHSQPARRCLSAATDLSSWVLLKPQSRGIASSTVKGLRAPLCSAPARLSKADVTCGVTIRITCFSCVKNCRSCYRCAPGVSLGKGKF